jgi:hypothetical protein
MEGFVQTRLSRAVNAAAYGMLAWHFSSLAAIGLLGSVWAAYESNWIGLGTAPLGAGFLYVAIEAIRAMQRELQSPYV